MGECELALMLRCQQVQRTLDQMVLGGDRPYWPCPVVGSVLFRGLRLEEEEKAGTILGMSEPFSPHTLEEGQRADGHHEMLKQALAFEEHSPEIWGDSLPPLTQPTHMPHF